MLKIVKPSEIETVIGTEVGLSDWVKVDQERINKFGIDGKKILGIDIPVPSSSFKFDEYGEMNRFRDQERQSSNMHHIEKMINKQELVEEQKSMEMPIQVRHTEVNMMQYQQPVVDAAPPEAPVEPRKKKVVEQDASVFLTGMADDQEMEEDDEDVQIQSVENKY